MGLLALDHINIRTAQLRAMVRFYEDVVGLKEGERPAFAVNGSWLYCGPRPVVHLIEVPDGTPWSVGALEHYAFEAEGLGEFVEHLKAGGTPYEIVPVPGIDVRQVHLTDPDGNHLHIDFSSDEPTN